MEVLDRLIIGKIPGGQNHNGGRIGFGPDGMLYITTGETFNAELAQNLDSLGMRDPGKGSTSKPQPVPRQGRNGARDQARYQGIKLTSIEISKWRIRIGNYRIQYDIEGNKVILLRILHRKDIYRK